ncbi:MAG TPA: SagB/ThcOx family dehydrogenase [Anaerohalosphaeraceae bacterium]|nr:SagB/ThcOx family dehydrogenase [Phycisphaerae bacterium]HOK95560.1 SagB/ThcOx family dehydrogenase [Anaerohalosphaeraceae bacterium]HOL32243.1 SagB/ThcOx family dehydrogenase [Anaerohalosphaeraceae bacterium]HOM76407.1 SagB/ThcOx family dehydrogenase [Anaerohalosphaeraceae bacterium]HPC63671.1 SagB/ThcOx family dehydrogenase [Anaerohalosphaeraceae bacterium]
MHDAGDRFQKETKYRPDTMPAGSSAGAVKPKLYKTYPDSPQIKLPDVRALSAMPLSEALKNRRSIRRYQNRPISAEMLSYLLWAGTGISRVEGGYEFRTAPSAGALYPIETYLAANKVADIPAGLYHYSIRNHSLELLGEGDYGGRLARAALGQGMCASASAVFIWTAVFERTKQKYGQRAYRYIYLDAGHIAQNLALAAVSLGLGSCPIGALADDEVNQIIGADGTEESVLYMSTVGWF